jgi:flagellar basal body-associated protein FliL
MTDAQLWSTWGLWLAFASVLVLVAAGLLIAVLVAARGILSEALRALAAGEKVQENTRIIWELQTTNEVAGNLLDAAQSIERGAGAMADALEAHAGAGGVR